MGKLAGMKYEATVAGLIGPVMHAALQHELDAAWSAPEPVTTRLTIPNSPRGIADLSRRLDLMGIEIVEIRVHSRRHNQ